MFCPGIPLEFCNECFDLGFVGPGLAAVGAGFEKAAVDCTDTARCPAGNFAEDVVVSAHIFLAPRTLALAETIFAEHGPIRKNFASGVERGVTRRGGPVFPTGILLGPGAEGVPFNSAFEVFTFVGGFGIVAAADVTIGVAVADPMMPAAQVWYDLVEAPF